MTDLEKALEHFHNLLDGLDDLSDFAFEAALATTSEIYEVSESDILREYYDSIH